MAEWYRVVSRAIGGQQVNVVFSETAEAAVDTFLRLHRNRVSSAVERFEVTPVTIRAKGGTEVVDIPHCTCCNKPGGREAIYLMPIDKVEYLCKSCMDEACR